MDRCPNCGAAVRSGARFCTSCGRRLSPAPDEGQEGAIASAGAGEAPAAAPTWEQAQPSMAPPAVEQGWERRTPVASVDLWPVSARPQEAPGEDESAGEGASAADAVVAPQPEESETAAVETAAWPASPWSSWAMPETIEPVADGSEGTFGTEQTAMAAAAAPAPDAAPAAESLLDDLPPDLRAAFAEPDDAAESRAESAGSGGVDQATPPDGEGPDSAADEVQAAPGPEPAPRSDAAALGRALGLVDELRALLPAVAGVEGVDLAGAVAELVAARNAGLEVSRDELDRLTAAVVEARERPREIDALLGLTGNLQPLAVVVETYRRYAEAIDRAVTLLGADAGTGGAGDGNEPRDE